jgi:hypothetical protein
MIRRAGIFVGALLFFACSDAVSPGDGDIQIRIGNESSSPFSNVAVIFPEQEVDYGAVRVGGVSNYRRVTVAYGYARIDVQIGSTALRIQPIDYVGESQLQPGRYTYALDIIDGHLMLELKRDD